MKFVENVKPDISTDIVFMMCPMHLLKLDEQIKELQQGQILEIITDYDGALEDIPGWCEKTGNEFIGLEDTGDFYKFYIKKVAR
jgi:TusA-related sulfurtransferase